MFGDPYARIVQYESEQMYEEPRSGQLQPFPSLKDEASVDLSVIIPAYNEEDRLKPMLNECLEYLEGRAEEGAFQYEVIVVDDGSRDNTYNVALQYSRTYGCDKVRVLQLEHNRGKGGAVRLGMLRARGGRLLFADADGATKFSDLYKLEKEYKKIVTESSEEGEFAIAVGSRAHLEKESMATRSMFRTILMLGFHLLVWCFGVRGVKDTQCGFKLLSRRAAELCFRSLHVERWAFDVELLLIARHFNIPICEVAVNWTEIEGSKIVPFWSWLEMGRDLIMIWLRYRCGIWKIHEKEL